jgi:hypothetical protein
LRPRLVRIGVPFEDTFNVLLPVPPFSEAGANLEGIAWCNLEGIAWCNLDSFGVTWSFVAMMSDSSRRARVGIVG